MHFHGGECAAEPLNKDGHIIECAHWRGTGTWAREIKSCGLIGVVAHDQTLS